MWIVEKKFGEVFYFGNYKSKFQIFVINIILVFSFFCVFGLISGASARSAPESFADLAAKLLPSVVNISTTSAIKNGRGSPQLPQFPPGSPFEEFFREFMDKQPMEQRRRTSLGSGFIIDKTGIIVTNNHVIQDAEKITVILHDKTKLAATLVGRDPKTDLAVLKVESKARLPFVSLGNSDKLRVGDWVVAIGNPFGLGGTVTAGIVSARGRDINSGPYDNYIQTDASINRGNSGGPLFNLKGEVVGINSAIYSPTGGSVGIGFSIPTSTAATVVDQLRRYGRTRRGWLGVRIQQVTEVLSKEFGLKKPSGALVAEVTPGSPADGKIMSKDIILSFNGQSVKTMKMLPRIVANTKIGQKVPVIVWRDQKKVTLRISIGELKEEQASVAKTKSLLPPTSNKGLEIVELGLMVENISNIHRRKFNIKNSVKGVVITYVDPQGTAAEQQLRTGEVIVEVGQVKVRTTDDVKEKIAAAVKSGRGFILFLVVTQNGPNFKAIRIGKG